MASAVIHMAVASEINKILKRDNNLILIGSIAPDISKHIEETKMGSHFLDRNDSIPNIDRFLAKYRKNLDDDFVMGYFIHLYTDYLWFNYFLPEVYDKKMVTKLDGTEVKCNGNMLCLYFYNDYTNLNIKLLDEYDMDLHIFYSIQPEIDHIIEEIPMDKLQIIIDQTANIISKSKEKKEFVFNMDNIKTFIETSVNLILAKIDEILNN